MLSRKLKFDPLWKYGISAPIKENLLTSCAYEGPVNTPQGTFFQPRECFCQQDQTPENCAECREWKKDFAEIV